MRDPKFSVRPLLFGILFWIALPVSFLCQALEKINSHTDLKSNQSTEDMIDSGALQISSYIEIGDGVLGNQNTEDMIDSGALQISSYVEVGDRVSGNQSTEHTMIDITNFATNLWN